MTAQEAISNRYDFARKHDVKYCGILMWEEEWAIIVLHPPAQEIPDEWNGMRIIKRYAA